MPTKCNFWWLFRSQSIKTRSSPWDSGFEESGLLVHLIVIERTIFCAAFLREMLTGPPTKRCSPWSPPSRRCWWTSPGRTSRGPTTGSGRSCRRPLLLMTIYSAKCQVYMKRKVSLRCHSLRIFCNSFCKLQKTGVNTARTLYMLKALWTAHVKLYPNVYSHRWDTKTIFRAFFFY